MWAFDWHLGFTYTFHFFYLKSNFYLLQYVIVAADIIIKQQIIVLASNSFFPYNLQLPKRAHIRVDKTKNDFKTVLVIGG